MVGKFRSIVPVVLATTALLLGAVTAGCDNHGAPPAAPTTAHTQPAAPSAPAPETKQGTFTIMGIVPTLKGGSTVKLRVFDPKGSLDKRDKTLTTAKVEHGRFTLTGTTGQPLPGMLQFGSHAYARMIVESGTFTVVDTGVGLAVKGGDYNNQAYGYRWMPSYVAALKTANAAYKKAFAGVNEMDEKAVKAARKATAHLYDPAQKIKNDYQCKILDGNGPALLKLLVLRKNDDGKRYDDAKRAAMLTDYAYTLGANNPLIVRMRATAARQKKLQSTSRTTGVGKPYKDVVAMDVNGKRIKLSAVLAKHKLELLDFWASWCGPCRGEFPFMRKVYQEFHKQGFEIYAISLDKDRGDWLKALREEGDKDPGKASLPWINLNDPDPGAKSATAYGVRGLPSNYLISSDGTIVGVNMREWNLKKTVQTQLKKGGGSHGA